MNAVAIADIYALSPMQEAMLFHALHTPETGTSFNQLSCRLGGQLDVARFRKAWQQLVDRHPILRTSFHWEKLDKPVQVVHPELELPWVEEDWRELAHAEQQARWRDHLQHDLAAGFALDRAPLMRCRLARISEDSYLFNWSHHHILSDGWCLSLVMEEILHAYGRLANGLAPVLPPVHAYRDYIQWLQRQDPEGAKAYWTRYLAGFRAPTPMPARAERNERFGAAVSQLRHELPEALSTQLRSFAAQHRLTLNTLVQGVWAILLARYSAETEVVFGNTVSGRPTELPGVESMLGLFINTVPVRVQVDPRQPLVPWLKMIQARAAARSRFEHMPPPDIQRCSEVSAALPLFESNVVFMNYPLDESLVHGAHGLTLDEIELYDRADVPVELQVTAQARWKIELSFDPLRFAPDTMQRMLGHVAALLENFTAAAGQPLGRRPMLAAHERRQLLEEFNDTAVPFDAACSIVQRLEQAAAEAPERIAVECADVALSAHELNARANRLARRLLATAELGADDLVAICAHRSERMMEAILAVWKCGAAYLPIDPDYPASRIRSILQDSRAKLIITTEGLLDPALAALAPCVLLGHRADAVAVVDDSNLERPIAPDSLAYVIYTSGSTGKPKGAMVEHAGMLNHMLAEIDEFAIDADTALAQNASHCFDISVWQFFTAPLMGGRTVIFGNDLLHDPARFLERLESARINLLELVPSYLPILLDGATAKPSTLRHLRCLLVTGEMTSPALLKTWFAAFPAIPVVNAYGPAEASDDIAQHRMDKVPTTPYVPVGKPIRNLRIYIADAQMNLCPIGVPGELCVAGIGVGRGYLNDADGTRAVFLEDPFDAQRGMRMYRTGDTGCWLVDGSILLHGRKDHQVKIRGHRIELGEIDNALAALASIRQAAVLDHRDEAGHTYLCAYVTFRAGAAPTDAQLAAALSTTLPDYMVPGIYVVMDNLPLNANGKIERKALPPPDRSRRGAKPGRAPPRNAVETLLCGIWSEALGIPTPGIHDNLFALGGDSILSMRIVALAARAGLKLSTRQIFQHPTIAELGAVVVLAQAKTAELIATSGPLPLTPVQRHFFQQRKHNPNQYNQAVLLEVPADLDLDTLRRALRHAAKLHDALRLRFHPDGVAWIQHVVDEWDIPTAASDIAEDQLAQHIALAHANLDIGHGPVFRAELFRFGPERPARLLFVAHHLAIDGASWGVLLETIYAAYAHLRSGDAPETPLAASSWTAWTQAIAAWARDGALDADLAYWEALAHADLPALPLDHCPPARTNTVASADEVVVELDEAATAALLTHAPQAYDAQIDDLLLAALALAFKDGAGAPAILLDLETHGREEVLPELDISRTVGWFTSIFPVLLKTVPGQSDLGQLVASIKQQWRALPSRGFSYGLMLEKLARIVQPPQLLFNYLGQIDRTWPGAYTWKQAAEASGDGRDPQQQREHVLEINSYVSDGRLRIAWEFSRHFHQRETIQGLARHYLAAIEALLAHAAANRRCADVSAARLPQESLRALIAGLADEADAVYELTPTQQGMLFHSLYEPASDAYFSSVNFRIEGDLDGDRFRRAWAEAIARHEALRTSFHWEDLESPVQVVHREAVLPWHEEDLSALPGAIAERRWAAYLEQDRTRGFRLSEAPLTRLGLFRLDARAWRFHWSHHHILLDGWSSSLLMSEVIAVYDALANPGAPPLPAPPPFREHVRWLQRQDVAAAERYWSNRLAGFDTPTPLVLGRPELEGTARPGRVVEAERRLDAESTHALLAYAQANHLTLNTLAQGAWALLLGRYSGETDVLFGTIVSGRPAALPESDRMVGLFINSLPVRVRIGEGTAAPWLLQLQMELAQQEEYAYYPLAEIQKFASLAPGTPLFESLLIFQNYPVEETLGRSASGLKVSEYQVFDPNNYPLTLVVTPGERLCLQALYDDGRFDRETIERLLQHFENLLLGLVSAGSPSIRTLPMLGPREQERILCEWNASDTPVPAGQTLLDLIEAAALAHPERVAVRCGERVRSYGELIRNAQRIARHLQALAPIQADDRIALWMPRSETMLETILAIWSCGAAYVPIDPAYPAHRVEAILAGARPALVVAQGQPLPAACAELPSIDPQRFADEPAIAPFASRCRPQDLAYVIFTSGSTGTPKGAMLEQQGMFNHVLGMVRELELGAKSAVAQTASHCSDISVWQCFAALAAGGKTVIYEDVTILEPALLIEDINRDGITAMQFVPSYLAALLAELEVHETPTFRRLETLLTIGETLQPASVRTWFRLNPDIRLMNAYGPTEASDSIAHYLMDRPPALPSIPIGKPVQNLRLYVVDTEMNLCPVGVKGEICVAGIGVGRGYLFDEARTRAVFGEDPFRVEPGSRLYHTGDVGCFAADGNLRFFGRRDFQVKIRGYRIELGEIETALTDLAGIANAVVVARKDSEGNTILCGYAAGSGWTPVELRQALREKLPVHMLPDALMLVAELPTTPNGKIDRKALPLPDDAAPTLGNTTSDPQTLTETALARIFAEVLAHPSVGADDNFFELGGQSLKAVQMVSRIRRELKLELTVTDIFAAPSPRALARKLGDPAIAGVDDAPIPALPAQAWYPVSRAQKRIWLAERGATPGSYNMAGALRIEGAIDADRLAHALERLAERHESLRTVFALSEGELKQRVLGRVESGFRVERRSIGADLDEQDLPALIRAEAERPFDLAAGPLFRASLIRCSPSTHVLLLTMHHAISDAWSIRVLTEDLHAIYASRELPPLSIQYRDYAHWHNTMLASPQAAAHRAYWHEQLAPLVARLQVPTDYPRPEHLTQAGQVLEFELLEPHVTGLAALARACNVSLYSVVLSSLCVLLHRYTGREDLVIGSASAGRDREQLETQVGVFVNTLALRIRLQPSASVAELIGTVAKASAAALEHAAYPFDLLLEELKVRTPANHFPLFDIQVDYVTAAKPQHDLQITDISPADTTTKFDLSFHIVEDAGRLLLRLGYRTQLFAAETIAAMLRRLVDIQEAFMLDLQAPVDSISLAANAPSARRKLRANLRLKAATIGQEKA